MVMLLLVYIPKLMFAYLLLFQSKFRDKNIERVEKESIVYYIIFLD